MPRVTVIDSTKRRIVLWDGTAVRAIPYDPYHSLKYEHFDGNRIFHAFGGDRRLRVEETYNDGIFNAYMTSLGDGDGGGEEAAAPVEMIVQIPEAIGIAKAVMADDGAAFEKIFRHYHGKHMQSEIVDYLMVAGNANRVRPIAKSTLRRDTGVNEGAYVIDDRFMVDEHGSAYYYSGDDGRMRAAPDGGAGGEDEDIEDGRNANDNNDDDDDSSMGIADMNDWSYLCLVVEEGGKDGGDEPAVKVPGKGAWRMAAVTRMVIAKIAFLLHPAADRVFLNQLPDSMRSSVVRMIKDGDAY